jgi:diacylglycerol kinase
MSGLTAAKVFFDGSGDSTPGSSEAKYLREPGWHLGWRGLRRALRQDARLSFHIFLAVLTLAAAWVLGLSYLEWCLVLAGIGARFGGELWLGAIRHLAAALPPESREQVRGAIELGAGALLILMGTSALVVSVILLHRLIPLFD